MKLFLKIAPRILVLLVFMVLLDAGVRFFYEPYDRNAIYTRSDYKEDRGNIDTIFVGTSQTYAGFDPAVFDERLGTDSFNLGSNAQLMYSSYHLIHEALTINPVKTVYLEINDASLTRAKNDSAQVGCFDYLISWREKFLTLIDGASNSIQLRSMFYGLRDIDYFDFSFLKENLTYKLTEGHTPPQKEKDSNWQYYTKGHIVSTSSYKGPSERVIKRNKIDWSVDKVQEKNLVYLQKIIDLCKEKDVELILVTPCIYKDFLTVDVIDLHNYVSELAKENGLTYYDMNALKARNTYFPLASYRDKTHLNQTGAETLSNLLCDLYENPNLASELFLSIPSIE